MSRDITDRHLHSDVYGFHRKGNEVQLNFASLTRDVKCCFLHTIWIMRLVRRTKVNMLKHCMSLGVKLINVRRIWSLPYTTYNVI